MRGRHPYFVSCGNLLLRVLSGWGIAPFGIARFFCAWLSLYSTYTYFPLSQLSLFHPHSYVSPALYFPALAHILMNHCFLPLSYGGVCPFFTAPYFLSLSLCSVVSLPVVSFSLSKKCFSAHFSAYAPPLSARENFIFIPQKKWKMYLKKLGIFDRSKRAEKYPASRGQRCGE